jgi:hypothetical protein
MIGIQLEGDNEFLKTNRDTSISMRLENPIFFTADKISPGSYSLPFDLPNENFEKLKNPQVIENSEDFIVERAALFFDGQPLKRGNINASTITDKISTFFTFGLSTISDEFKTAKLRDVVSDIITISSAPVVRKVHTNCLQINIIVNGIDYTKGGLWYRRLPSYPAGPYIDAYLQVKQMITFHT